METKINPQLQKVNELYDRLDYLSVIALCHELLLEKEFNKDQVNTVEVYQILSKVYINLGDLAKAFAYALEAEELLQGNQFISPALENVNCFAKILIKSYGYDEAIRLLKKGIKIANKNNDSKHLSYMFNLLGVCCIALKQYEVAQGYLKNALEIAIKNDYLNDIIEITINMGLLNVYKGIINVAKMYSDEAFEKAIKTNQEIYILGCYLLNSNIAYEKKNYEEALGYAIKSVDIAKKTKLNLELLKAYEWLYKIYEKLFRFEEAYYVSLKYISLKEEISNEEKATELNRMRVQYDYIQQNKEMKKLESNYIKVTQQRQELQNIMDVMGKQNEELLSIAINDYLTGTYNRKYFMLKFEEEFSIAEENGTAVSCLVFDIDKFKAINDTYGHLAGDEVIKHIVDICNSEIDQSDIIGRFGGDEFVIILMGKGLDEAVSLGQTILNSLRTTSIIVEKQEITATISVGVTDNRVGNPTNAEDMIRIADKALYMAKDNGRNQLCFAQEQQKDYDYL